MWFFSLLVSLIRWSFVKNFISYFFSRSESDLFDHLFFALIARCVRCVCVFRMKIPNSWQARENSQQQACYLLNLFLNHKQKWIIEVHDQRQIFAASTDDDKEFLNFLANFCTWKTFISHLTWIWICNKNFWGSEEKNVFRHERKRKFDAGNFWMSVERLASGWNIFGRLEHIRKRPWLVYGVFSVVIWSV